MKKVIVIALAGFLTITFTTFAAQKVKKPHWIDNPGMGVSASSTTHVKGRHFQEELAVARARERLAARYGVDIESVHTIHEQVINDRAYVTSDKQMKLVLKKKTVKARVRAKWHDNLNDTFWVWVYPIGK